MKTKGKGLITLLGSPVIVALISLIVSTCQRPSVPQQRVNGELSSVVNVQDSPNANISIGYSNQPRLAIDKIKLAERYAYEFDNYLGSTNGKENMSRIIEQHAILRRRYNPNENVRLTPAIINSNKGIPLQHASIQLIFGQGIIVADRQTWIEQEVNSRYSRTYNESINNTPLNTDSIFIRFPSPGRYAIKVLIDGDCLEEVYEVDYFIELYEKQQ